MYKLLAIAAAMSSWCRGEAKSAESIIPKTESSDGRYAFMWRPGEGNSDGQVILFDRTAMTPLGTDLSQTNAVFRLIATSETMRSETPESYRPLYRVAWSEDADMVAIHAGFHQFSSVLLFRRTKDGLRTLSLPPLTAFKRRIEDEIAPFRLSKLWSSRPCWLSKRRLHFDVTGSAFREPAQREGDILDLRYGLVIRVEDGETIAIESFEKKNSPTSGSR